MNNEEFMNMLVGMFPKIKDDVLDEDVNGLVGLQIGYFKRFVQNAIDENDLIEIKKCFQFINDNIEKVDYKVKNAIYLSLLNKLSFDKNPNAEKFLPKKLLSAKGDLDDYEASKITNIKLNNFLDNL
ncbi:hypothetical protein ACFE6N_22960 [Pedobacter sp. BG31]|uniref:DUF7674 family protein n=1 Tax=Pedobacter sp. BG31 TaxID=3349697 RepID=UPI0035F438A4